jgi:hypothetical protein
MCEYMKDVYSAQGEWVWPRWRGDKIVKYRVKLEPFDPSTLEEAPF